MYNNIPEELRFYPQWCLWRYEDRNSEKPTKVPYHPSGQLCSVTDPATWSTFDQALICVGNYDGMGFVLSDNDPFCFIDLDHTTDQKNIDRQLQIYETFKSYSEVSPSGNGLHIIVKASVNSGRKRSFVELYSNKRYMTVTGNVYGNLSINNYQEQVTSLWQQMGHSSVAAEIYAGLAQEKETDEQIINNASLAANGIKFLDLLNGNWQNYYPSQSEADLSFINIVAFYTQNRKQIQRIFVNSALGRRDKAKRQDYVNWMINKSFDRMLPPIDIDGLQNQLNAVIESKAIEEPVKIEPQKDIYTVPPGLVGEIARFIHDQAPRPVPEIALVGALGFMSGIVGRCYNISGTGLNQYILLLAQTGTGKEAIANGIGRLIESIKRNVPASSEFIGPSKINSEQALINYMDNGRKSFVSIIGEFGNRLQEMSGKKAPEHMKSLLTFLTDIFNKSGENNVLRPSIYSDKTKNTKEIYSPAVSLIGEGTPERFYNNLSEDMISCGLLPRFTIIEYCGERKPFNKYHNNVYPTFDLIEKLGGLCAHCLNLNSQNKIIKISLSNEAETLLDAFNNKCDGLINDSSFEVKRNLWNRAHIKALKLAGMIAVGINPYNPIVDEQSAQWAINLVTADVKNVISKFDNGEVGNEFSENTQDNQLMRVIKGYVLSKWSELEKYKTGNSRLHQERIIPYSFLHKRLNRIACFKKDKTGATNAIKKAIVTLIEKGDLQEVPTTTLVKTYNVHGKYYMISNAKAFDII
jgi:hypothetical protein